MCLYCCSTFHSYNHSRIFTNEYNSYPNISFKRHLFCSCVVLLTSAGKTLHLDIFVVLILFGVYNIICQMEDYQQVFHVNYKKKYDPPP